MNLDPDKYYFSDTSFDLLMQKRIRKVLILSSNYDAFILEEDGRVEEQIFNEYVSLNLRYPPFFIHADNIEEAIKILKKGDINLFIVMHGHGAYDAFEIPNILKNYVSGIPIVLLTQFTREISLKLVDEDLQGFDYIFNWLGNADLLLGIIKLIEDKMNAPFDISEMGVQCILFVEDSIRYISTFLPVLYKIILEQSRDFTSEALNEHQKMLRKRGRPKIMLATNLEEARRYFELYKNNILGIISDISFRENNNKKSPKILAGLQFGTEIKNYDGNIPIIYQSSDPANLNKVRSLNCNFIQKSSPFLLQELKQYLLNDFGFGDFIFRDPENLNEVARAKDLKFFQEELLKIPDNVLYYHAHRDHFSRWLKARALFPIARLLKDIKPEDFDNISQTRKFIYNVISRFRALKSKGIIADFNIDQFDIYSLFIRSGEGSIGGKARGLAFIEYIIKKNNLQDEYSDVDISIPKSLALSTGIFDEFISNNQLYEFAVNCDNDNEILQRFLQSELPEKYISIINKFIETINNPIAVRSSSKLEDSYFHSFAGIYSTYMVDISDKNYALNNVLKAIKAVYASVYYKSSKSYITATSNLIDEEKMGVILQEICGSKKGDYYYPAVSGVLRSLNFYPLENEKHDEGSVSLAVGLGKYIAEGGLTLHLCPKFAQNAIQISGTDQMLKYTQKNIIALNTIIKEFIPSTDSSNNIVTLKINELPDFSGSNHIFSTFDPESQIVRDNIFMDGKRLITFNPVIKHCTFPLVEILNKLILIGKKEMNNHIEIEFALDFKNNHKPVFNILQIRPINIISALKKCPIESKNSQKSLLYSDSAMGNGYFEHIRHIVYIKKTGYDPSSNKMLANMVNEINADMIKKSTSYLLIGPGRWGSADPWLGIPVNWAQVSNARVIVEYYSENLNVESSHGSHFFHNLVQFSVGYFLIKNNKNNIIDHKFLETQKAINENNGIRIIELEKDLKICIDGKSGKGIIIKPD